MLGKYYCLHLAAHGAILLDQDDFFGCQANGGSHYFTFTIREDRRMPVIGAVD
jgi:hypothetical protein